MHPRHRQHDRPPGLPQTIPLDRSKYPQIIGYPRVCLVRVTHPAAQDSTKRTIKAGGPAPTLKHLCTKVECIRDGALNFDLKLDMFVYCLTSVHSAAHLAQLPRGRPSARRSRPPGPRPGARWAAGARSALPAPRCTLHQTAKAAALSCLFASLRAPGGGAGESGASRGHQSESRSCRDPCTQQFMT